MSVTTYGVSSPVTGKFSGSIDNDRRESIVETEVVRLSARNARLATLRALIGTPSAVFSQVNLRGIDWSDIDGDFTEIRKTYAGADDADSSDPDDPLDNSPSGEISLEISTQEQPLLTHPRYRDAGTITAAERTALAKVAAGDIEAEEDISSALGLEALGKLKNGVEAFLSPTLTLRERGVATAGAQNLGAVGKRITSGLPGGMPAVFGSGQTWLYAGLNQTAFGTGRVEFERVFLGSGFGGWDTDLYDATGI